MNVMLWLVQKIVGKHCSAVKPLSCADLDSWRLPACRCCCCERGFGAGGNSLQLPAHTASSCCRISLHHGWTSGTSPKTFQGVRRAELFHCPAHEPLGVLQHSRKSVLNIREPSLKWGMPKDNAQSIIFLNNFSFLLLKFLLRCLLWQDLPWKNLNLPQNTPSTDLLPSYLQTQPSQGQKIIIRVHRSHKQICCLISEKKALWFCALEEQ